MNDCRVVMELRFPYGEPSVFLSKSPEPVFLDTKPNLLIVWVFHDRPRNVLNFLRSRSYASPDYLKRLSLRGVSR